MKNYLKIFLLSVWICISLGAAVPISTPSSMPFSKQEKEQIAAQQEKERFKSSPLLSKEEHKSSFLERIILKKLTKKIQKEYSKEQTEKKDKKFHAFSVVSFLSSLASLVSLIALSSEIFGYITPFFFFSWLLCAIAAIVLGIIGLVRISRNKEVYAGKGLCIAGISLGGLNLLLVLATIAILIWYLAIW